MKTFIIILILLNAANILIQLYIDENNTEDKKDHIEYEDYFKLN